MTTNTWDATAVRLADEINGLQNCGLIDVADCHVGEIGYIAAQLRSVFNDDTWRHEGGEALEKFNELAPGVLFALRHLARVLGAKIDDES